jgi:hypothetical protein
VVGVDHPHFRRVVRGLATHRRILREAGEDRRLTPRWIIEPAIDCRFGDDLRDTDVGLAERPWKIAGCCAATGAASARRTSLRIIVEVEGGPLRAAV